MIILILIFIILFLLNYLTFWVLLIKISDKKSNFFKVYTKIFPVIWIFCINLIPIINSSFLEPIFNENISYFRQYWIWFLFLGIIFLTVGFRIYSLEKRILKYKKTEKSEFNLITSGVYNVVRHPNCLAWFLIFIGSAFILDSFISIILIVPLIVLTDLHCFLKEKYVLVPKYGEVYEIYKDKNPYRIISPPYNYLFFIIGIFVIYIGILNFRYWF